MIKELNIYSDWIETRLEWAWDATNMYKMGRDWTGMGRDEIKFYSRPVPISSPHFLSRLLPTSN